MVTAREVSRPVAAADGVESVEVSPTAEQASALRPPLVADVLVEDVLVEDIVIDGMCGVY